MGRIEIAGAVFAVLAWFCARRGRRNWHQFRAGLGKPLLDGVTPDQLAGVPVTWPLASKRWPPPALDGTPPMEPPMAAAYGRLAERSKRIRLIAAELFLTVGGAWLGVSLPGIWTDYRANSREATRDLEARSTELVVPPFSLAELAHLMPVFVVGAGIMMLIAARDYEVAQRVYERAARPGPPEQSVVAAPRGVRRRLRRFLGRYS